MSRRGTSRAACAGSFGCAVIAAAIACACGDNLRAECVPEVFETGDDGHPEPLSAGPGQARAGRIAAGDLPPTPRNLAAWAAGDFVVANDRIAVVIEDVGPSDGYDPWGGRIVGIARIDDGRMVDAPDFNEMFVLTGRYAVVTESVSVLSDGADQGPAIVRAAGPQAPLPFFENIVGALLRDDVADIPAAIDYVLEPDAEHLDVFVVYRSGRARDTSVLTALHGFMFTDRLAVYVPALGFAGLRQRAPYLAWIDDPAAGYAYEVPGETLGPGVSTGGFVSAFTGELDIAACGSETRRHYARLTIGAPGIDGVLQAVARTQGTAQREITGVVRDAQGLPVTGARVHAEAGDEIYLTRSSHTDDDGAYRLHVPAGAPVQLTAYVAGVAVVGPVELAADGTAHDFSLPAAGRIEVTATDADAGGALPVRVTVLPVAGAAPPSLPRRFGEPDAGSGRLQVVDAVTGQATIAVPAGTWEVVVSRGFEYELVRQIVDVAPAATVQVGAALSRVIDTTGAQCADYHIHTFASSDSPDDAAAKIRNAVTDGLEIPVRSEHERVASFQTVVDQLGLAEWAFGVTSVELTSMETWGHMGVLPLEVDPEAVNGGTPAWQEFPTPDDPTAPVVTLSPRRVFDAVRARREQPIVIINHPRGGVNYFDYVGLDPQTGLVDFPDDWDEEFRVIEVFNHSGWRENLAGTVTDWLGLLRTGRPVFAVGSSDSHRIRSEPLGYPRTCLRLGTDDPRELTPQMVRDATAAGHATVSGGIYIDVDFAGSGPGETAAAGPAPSVQVRVQAASWVAVDWIDVVVDGELVDTIAVTAGDADPSNPAIRWQRDLAIAPAGGLGSFVIVAAYGDTALDPVHPGKLPFAVSNPIFFE